MNKAADEYAEAHGFDEVQLVQGAHREHLKAAFLAGAKWQSEAVSNDWPAKYQEPAHLDGI